MTLRNNGIIHWPSRADTAGLSGQIFYDYVNSTLWAIVYTGLPIVLFGVYDMDVLPGTALRYPWLYRNGVDDELLTKKFFWGWIAQARLSRTLPVLTKLR